MSAYTCPDGHASTAGDYCDVCGAPIDEAQTPGPGTASVPGQAPPAPGEATPAPATGEPCPNCALVNAPDALFCEGCGYDFTTGTMPREATPANPLDLGSAPPASAATAQPAQPAAAEQPATSVPASTSTAHDAGVDWVAEVWVDPDWYAEQASDEQCPSPGLPVVVPLRARSLLIGRLSKSRNISPEIECSSDIGVSRRQAQLTSDGQRWWVEDLQSANGTYVGAASSPLPTDALPPGQRRELGLDDRIYVGAWTCIVVRRATPEEQAGPS